MLELMLTQAKGASDGDSFADIMGNLEQDSGGDSEGLTFADILQRVDLLSETLLEALVVTPDMPLC